MPTSGARRRHARRSAAASRVAATVPSVTGTPAVHQSEGPRKHAFFLVQDLMVLDSDRRGFDGKFVCDYMGSAEYESGAIPRSLQRIRGAGDLIIRPVVVTRGGVTKTVYFVGPRQGMDEKVSDFTTWFALDRPECRERTNFTAVFSGKNLLGETPYQKPDKTAWWSLNDDVGWALDKAVASRLLYAFARSD